MSEVHLRPSISLVSIQREEFLEKFRSGHYFTSNTPRRPITLANSVISSITSDQKKGTYRVYNAERGEKILATAGNRNYLVFEGSETNYPRRCDYCKCDYSGENYGVARSKDRHIVMKDGTTHVVYVFHTEGNNCSEEHAFGCIDMYQKYYADRENLRKLFFEKFSLTYPGREFYRSNVPELHEREGGSLTDEQWKDKRYLYTKHSVICSPIKVEHIRTTNKCESLPPSSSFGNSSSTM